MDFLNDSMIMEEVITAVVTGLTTSIPSALFGIAMYVLSALSLYTVAKRRGIAKPWLSWIPVVNIWILGSISDQYRYVVNGQNKSKRKALLVLNILIWVFSMVILTGAIAMLVQVFNGIMRGVGEDQFLEMMLVPLILVLGFTLPLLGVAIAAAIIRYMALYDVYKSMDPANCVVFLVLSILFNFTEPIFLFVCRGKDGGMPPRKQEPVLNPPMSYGMPIDDSQVSDDPADSIF